MGESATLRDFMMIAKATRVDDAFHSRVRETVRLAAVLHPEITWRADFDLGPCEHVDIFSAPDHGAARALTEMLNHTCGVHVELAPLRNGW